MEKYNVVFVPAKNIIIDGGWTVYEDSFGGSRLLGQVEPERNVIVLSEEELATLKKEEVLAFERWKAQNTCYSVEINNGTFRYKMAVKIVHPAKIPCFVYAEPEYYTEAQLYDLFIQSTIKL